MSKFWGCKLYTGPGRCVAEYAVHLPTENVASDLAFESSLRKHFGAHAAAHLAKIPARAEKLLAGLLAENHFINCFPGTRLPIGRSAVEQLSALPASAKLVSLENGIPVWLVRREQHEPQT
jgi:hypothetical protein